MSTAVVANRGGVGIDANRGIPTADFVEDVEGLMTKTGKTATELVEEADAQYNKVCSSAHSTLENGCSCSI
jgi:hypothetical protein